MLDKNLSLNLGRGSNFNDSDIDAEFFTPSTHPQQRPWDLMSLDTILFARLQGQVYERLYSACAIEAGVDERAAAIEELSSQVNALRNQLLSVSFSLPLLSALINTHITDVFEILTDRFYGCILSRAIDRNGAFGRFRLLFRTDRDPPRAIPHHHRNRNQPQML